MIIKWHVFLLHFLLHFCIEKKLKISSKLAVAFLRKRDRETPNNNTNNRGEKQSNNKFVFRWKRKALLFEYQI